MLAAVTRKRVGERGRSGCPIANSLELLGDRWTLVVVRDLMFSSKRRFGELLEGPEGITTNVLTDRLRRLEAGGVVQKRAYQQRPPRYEYLLTERGEELFEVMRALIRWGSRHLPDNIQFSEERLAAMDPRSQGRR
jgi:DNA-binding HxlR family transcriptional regulator